MTASQFLESLLPGLQSLGSLGYLADVLLAMAAHESGWNPVAQSTYVNNANPWGVECVSAFPCSQGFALYPSLTAAAQDLPAVLPPAAIAARGSAVAFMDALQAAGWDASAPTTYAQDVLTDYLPAARTLMEQSGLDPATAQPTLAPPTGPTPVLHLPGLGAPELLPAAGLALLLAGAGGYVLWRARLA